MADDADIVSESVQGDNISIEENETVDGQEVSVDIEDAAVVSSESKPEKESGNEKRVSDPGEEVTVDVEEVEILSRNELDDESFGGSELDDETFHGGELDDANIGKNDTVVNNTVKAAGEKEKKSKKRFMLFGGLGLLMLVLITGLLIDKKLFHIEKPLEKKPAAIAENQLREFDSFVIPSKGNTNYSYIHLSLSFVLVGQELKVEITENKNLLRGRIYDLLNDQANQVGWTPSLEQIKELAKQALNMNLSTGEIDEVYITKYLVI